MVCICCLLLKYRQFSRIFLENFKNSILTIFVPLTIIENICFYPTLINFILFRQMAYQLIWVANTCTRLRCTVSEMDSWKTKTAAPWSLPCVISVWPGHWRSEGSYWSLSGVMVPIISQINTLNVCVPMPTHCTIIRFRFQARWIDGVRCGLFSNHTPLGQTTFVWDEYLYSVLEKVVRVTISVTVCVV